MYLDRLWTHIEAESRALESGSSPEKYLVPGSRALLEELVDAGSSMYLASGTDQDYVREEADCWTSIKYFDGVFGALDDLKSFSKGLLIKRIIDRRSSADHEFLGFGDGYVEIEEVKKVGGTGGGRRDG